MLITEPWQFSIFHIVGRSRGRLKYSWTIKRDTNKDLIKILNPLFYNCMQLIIEYVFYEISPHCTIYAPFIERDPKAEPGNRVTMLNQ